VGVGFDTNSNPNPTSNPLTNPSFQVMKNAISLHHSARLVQATGLSECWAGTSGSGSESEASAEAKAEAETKKRETRRMGAEEDKWPIMAVHSSTTVSSPESKSVGPLFKSFYFRLICFLFFLSVERDL